MTSSEPLENVSLAADDRLEIAEDVPNNAVMSEAEAKRCLDRIYAAWKLTSQKEKRVAKNSLIHYMNKNAASVKSKQGKKFTVSGKTCMVDVAYNIIGPRPREFHRYHANLALELGRANASDFVAHENKFEITAGMGYMVIDVLEHASTLTSDEKNCLARIKRKKIPRGADTSDVQMQDYELPREQPVHTGSRPGNGGYGDYL